MKESVWGRACLACLRSSEEARLAKEDRARGRGDLGGYRMRIAQTREAMCPERAGKELGILQRGEPGSGPLFSVNKTNLPALVSALTF